MLADTIHATSGAVHTRVAKNKLFFANVVRTGSPHDPYTIQIIELVLYSIALVRAKKERGL